MHHTSRNSCSHLEQLQEQTLSGMLSDCAAQLSPQPKMVEAGGIESDFRFSLRRTLCRHSLPKSRTGRGIRGDCRNRKRQFKNAVRTTKRQDFRQTACRKRTRQTIHPRTNHHRQSMYRPLGNHPPNHPDSIAIRRRATMTLSALRALTIDKMTKIPTSIRHGLQWFPRCETQQVTPAGTVARVIRVCFFKPDSEQDVL